MAEKLKSVQVRMLRSVRIQEEGFHDGYARKGETYTVSPVVAQDWHYTNMCEYVNPGDVPTGYQPDAALRDALMCVATPTLKSEIEALKAQIALLASAKAK